MQSNPAPRFKVTASIKGMPGTWHSEMTRVNPREKLRKVLEAAKRSSKCVQVTIGDGSTDDNETFKRLMASDVPLTYYPTPRFGFKLVSFEFILLK